MKRRLRFEMYEFHDYAGMVNHLEKMAKKGWMLERMYPFVWIYRKIAPTELRFAISYADQLSEKDSNLNNWQYICSYNHMQIFYNTQKDPVSFHTNTSLEVSVIHQFFLRRELFPMSGILIYQTFFHLRSFSWRQLWTDPLELLSTLLLITVILSWFLRVMAYFCWYRKAKIEAEYGEFIPFKGRPLYLFTLLFVLTLLLCIMAQRYNNPEMLRGYIAISGLFLLFLGVYAFCQARQYSFKKQIIIMVLTAIIGTYAVLALFIA